MTPEDIRGKICQRRLEQAHNRFVVPRGFLEELDKLCKKYSVTLVGETPYANIVPFEWYQNESLTCRPDGTGLWPDRKPDV